MLSWLRQKATEMFGSTPRSGSWPRVRREHLKKFPTCAACGRSRDIEVHHVIPFHEHPELELDPENLISLCADPCHFYLAHLSDWSKSNPHIREDAERYWQRIRKYG